MMSGTWRYTFALHQLTIVCKQANSYIALIVEYYDTILFSTMLPVVLYNIIYTKKEKSLQMKDVGMVYQKLHKQGDI